jgi:hypothetical protein
MAAGNYDLLVDKRATFEEIINIASTTGITIDLNDYVTTGQVRAEANSDTVLAEFSFEILTATQLKMKLTKDQTTALLALGKGCNATQKYYYDILLTKKSDATVMRLLNGAAMVSPGVTR